MLLFLLLLFLMGVRLLPRTRRHGIGGRWHNWHDSPSLAASCEVRSQPKPQWVRDELVRLKAWSPDLGCRVIAEIFNRQFAERRVSVGKTYVAGVFCRSKSEIAYLRRTIKHCIPRPMPRNRTWALDLTGKTDLTGRQHMLLGLLDHGTGACLDLAVLPDKRSLTILKAVISEFRRYGLPKRLRVDNEICLNSRLMRGALALLGVHLQTTELHCPWQNGRIERFFGTLKQKPDTITVADGHVCAAPHQNAHATTGIEVMRTHFATNWCDEFAVSSLKMRHGAYEIMRGHCGRDTAIRGPRHAVLLLRVCVQDTSAQLGLCIAT
jgi:putative transposase